MLAKFRRGFKAKAERYAEGLRKSLDLSPLAPIPVLELANLLGVRVFNFSDFPGPAPAHKHLSQISALCFRVDRHCVVIVNDTHSKGRINSSLCHEFAHLLLGHEAEVIAITEKGCRNFDSEKEREADWLSGCILIPEKAAHRLVFDDRPQDQIALEYGVSLDMLKYRLNVSGAYKKKQSTNRKKIGSPLKIEE